MISLEPEHQIKSSQELPRDEKLDVSSDDSHVSFLDHRNLWIGIGCCCWAIKVRVTDESQIASLA